MKKNNKHKKIKKNLYKNITNIIIKNTDNIFKKKNIINISHVELSKNLLNIKIYINFINEKRNKIKKKKIEKLQKLEKNIKNKLKKIINNKHIPKINFILDEFYDKQKTLFKKLNIIKNKNF